MRCFEIRRSFRPTVGAVLMAAIVLAGCARQEYRFERIDAPQAVKLPMKFDSLYGIRDGDSVQADLRFVGENDDSVQIRMRLHLGPPAQFSSGIYRAKLAGGASEGSVSCDSLTYLGGQGDVPSIGGVFVLNDAGEHPAYRVSIPPTRVERRLRF
jgi:hypothetical protein